MKRDRQIVTGFPDHIGKYITDVPTLTSIGNSALWGTHLPETGCLIVLT